ncbi:hypothetical protein [Flavobacterium piscinae]|nr:hypothetical protein [Flavobacterium piscinae]
MNNKSVYITQTNCITPLGFDVNSNWDALQQGKSGIKLHKNVGNLEQFYASIISTTELNEVFDKTVFPFSVSDKKFTKLEKMLLLALLPLVEKHQISNRTAFVFSTTKGNISSLELESNPVKEAQLAFLAKK